MQILVPVRLEPLPFPSEKLSMSAPDWIRMRWGDKTRTVETKQLDDSIGDTLVSADATSGRRFAIPPTRRPLATWVCSVGQCPHEGIADTLVQLFLFPAAGLIAHIRRAKV